MKVMTGFYKSETLGNIDAVLCTLPDGTAKGIADFNGAFYIFSDVDAFIPNASMAPTKSIVFNQVTSEVFPEVARFFSKNISTLTIEFKG